MSAYTKQQTLMRKLGIAKLEYVETVKNESTWHATMPDGTVHIVKTHRMGTETGVLRTLAQTLKPILQ
jgi:hypothetical protein